MSFVIDLTKVWNVFELQNNLLIIFRLFYDCSNKVVYLWYKAY